MLSAKDILLTVGQRVTATILGVKYQISICGWLENSHIITDVPTINREYLRLAPHTGIHVYFVKDGTVISFESRVIIDHSQPPPYMIIEFPQSLEKVNMRRYERFKTKLPIVYVMKGEDISRKGTIFDVSFGGALITHVDPLMKGDTLLITAEIRALNLKMENLMATVQNVREHPKHKNEGFVSGVMYSDFSEKNQQALQTIIDLNKAKDYISVIS